MALTHRIERGPGWELHLADWRDVDQDSLRCDALIEDPPYGRRTHEGQKHKRESGSSGTLVSDAGLNYDQLEPADVIFLVEGAHAICDGWCLWHTSHDLIPAYEDACARIGRYCFAPVPVVMPGMNVRLAGDGPSNWTVQLVVTRTAKKKCWSTKPGFYTTTRGPATVVKGAKPLGLMEALIADYTEAGDLVVDRFAGGGTTGVAAVRNGRRFVGCERKPEHFEIALSRLRTCREQRHLFTDVV